MNDSNTSARDDAPDAIAAGRAHIRPDDVRQRLEHLFRSSLGAERLHPLWLPVCRYRLGEDAS